MIRFLFVKVFLFGIFYNIIVFYDIEKFGWFYMGVKVKVRK